MKRLLVRYSYVAILLLALSSLMKAADLMEDLQAFRKKIAAEEAKSSPNSPLRESQFSMQIQQIEKLIARDDHDRAMQTLENIGNYGIPPQFQDEWQQLSVIVGKEILKRKEERLKKWAVAVDELVKVTKESCLKAKTSGDLDELLFRCSAVQKQSDRSDTVMGVRLNHKLSGVTNTLSVWTSYLDYQAAGDGKQANESLRRLLTNNGSFPVLTVEEIEACLPPVASAQLDAPAAYARIFAGIDSPDDLSKALERLNAYTGNSLNPQLGTLRSEASRINAYMDAWKAIQTGDSPTAILALNRGNTNIEETQRYYLPIKARIETLILKKEVTTWTKLEQGANETSRGYLGRILDELKERGDYVTMLSVMMFASQFDRFSTPLFSYSDRQSIEQFLAAKRFEKAGDGLAAVTNYRLAVGYSGGKYAPSDEAQQALTELQSKYPEAFKSYESVLAEQIRGLSVQIQLLQQMRSTGSPNRPW